MQIGVKMGYAHHDRVNVIYSLAGSRYAAERRGHTMTPQQIAALTVAEMEYSGHSITAADQREIQRSVTDDIARRKRFG